MSKNNDKLYTSCNFKAVYYTLFLGLGAYVSLYRPLRVAAQPR